jgi:hypothetical protein
VSALALALAVFFKKQQQKNAGLFKKAKSHIKRARAMLLLFKLFCF